MQPAALFVDCYGTLVDGDRAAIEAVTRATSERAGVDRAQLDRAWLRRFTTLCAARVGGQFATQRQLELEAMTDVLGDLGISWPAAQVADLLEPLFDYWRSAEPFADAIGFLRTWTLCPVLIVSNIDRDDLARVRRGLPAVAGVVTSEDARAYKPSPAVFRRALTEAGVAAQRVVHVGDSWTSDVEGALGAGLTPVWLDRDGDGSSADRAEVVRITDLDDLADCIAALPQ